MERLFLVTRRDLPPGAQASQLAHAMAEFADVHPEVFQGWKGRSNTVVLLTAEDEQALKLLCRRAVDRRFRLAPFTEPDLGGALTAVALEPAAKALVRALPLAFS